MDPNPDLTGHNHRRGYESIDISPRPILLFLGGLITTAAVVHLLIFGQLSWYSREETTTAGRIAPLPPLKRQPTSEPRLQEAYAVDLADMRRRERAELGSSDWVDEKAGTVRIPIDEAMRVIAEKGLPARKSQMGTDAVVPPQASDAP
jgi:hypothetical protein